MVIGSWSRIGCRESEGKCGDEGLAVDEGEAELLKYGKA